MSAKTACIKAPNDAAENARSKRALLNLTGSRIEPLQQVAYLYDGTLEGLLSCVFEAYARHEDPEDVVPEKAYQPRFEQSSIFVSTSYDHALRVRRGVERAAGKRTFSAIAYAAANDDPQTGIAIYRFIRYLMDDPARDRRRSVLSDLSNPLVANIVAFEKHISKEAERMRQFVRFSRLENDIWFARCNPNANVIPLVMNHFAARFNIQPFIIYDEKHHVAGVYDGQSWYLVADDAVNVPARTAEDAYIEALWQQFYNSLAIQPRYNPELRRHFMPVRLWKNLPELNPLPRDALRKSD